MQRLVELWQQLDLANDAAEQRLALATYLSNASEADLEHAVRLLTGRRPKRLFAKDDARRLAQELSGLPGWLFAQSEAAAGDQLDAAALLVGQAASADPGPLAGWIEQLGELAAASADTRADWARRTWPNLSVAQLRWLLRLTASAARPRLAQSALAQALAEHVEQPAWLVALHLAEGAADRRGLLQQLAAPANLPAPDPFLTATTDIDRQQPVDDHCVMPHGLGTRVQLLRRGCRSLLWSGDGEFASAPPVTRAGLMLPDNTVLDAELIPGKSQLLAFDLLEHAGRDLRALPLRERQQELAALVRDLAAAEIRMGPYRHVDSWRQVDAFWQTAKELGAEALMVRHLAAAYDPVMPEAWRRYRPAAQRRLAVLLYAQVSGPQPELTLGLWRGSRLLPVARASAALPDDERRALTDWIRNNAIERFGPVRSVPPEQVFVLRFQDVRPSRRHKAGLILTEPAIEGWVHGMSAGDADSLDSL